ncbi:MAG: LPXTG cell wall anchor domain-containing protein [Ilumatobacteraceae bacterium]
MKIYQLIVSAAVTAAGLVGFGGIAAAAPPASTAVVACATVDAPAGGSISNGSVSTPVECDTAVCTVGVLATVTDDNGVQHQACVASAAAAPAPALAPAPAAAQVQAPARVALLSTPPTTSPQELPSTGAGTTGGLVIAALLVGSGSVASLLSRRKP